MSLILIFYPLFSIQPPWKTLKKDLSFLFSYFMLIRYLGVDFSRNFCGTLVTKLRLHDTRDLRIVDGECPLDDSRTVCVRVTLQRLRTLSRRSLRLRYSNKGPNVPLSTLGQDRIECCSLTWKTWNKRSRYWYASLLHYLNETFIVYWKKHMRIVGSIVHPLGSVIYIRRVKISE